eukprot:CAMPEP_0171663996 /NCGR_PEP_ID=MMETSP0990-20121206/46512_1 /TAXON_ID=483369 /ORGANISM="non described non described, Strain CCMP2098" /LENGTH=166 /DNA_ID=CAMNT_0012246773 /DNA_START=389 /DNA_END=889 /DNA_ORIENTATION=+
MSVLRLMMSARVVERTWAVNSAENKSEFSYQKRSPSRYFANCVFSSVLVSSPVATLELTWSSASAPVHVVAVGRDQPRHRGLVAAHVLHRVPAAQAQAFPQVVVQGHTRRPPALDVDAPQVQRGHPVDRGAEQKVAQAVDDERVHLATWGGDQPSKQRLQPEPPQV